MLRFTLAIFSLVFTTLQLAGQKPDTGHEIALDLQAGNVAAAQSKLRDALAASPRDARLWTFDGLTRAQLHDPKGALHSFQRALQLAPNYLPALEGAADLELQSESPDAIPLLRKIVQQRPDDPDFLRTLAAALTRDARTTEAIPFLQHLHSIQPQDAEALYALATAMFLAGRYSDVIGLLKEAPRTGRSLELLGESYEQTGDTQQAASTLKAAIFADPAVPDYYTDFAWLCLAHGHAAEGIEALNSGLQHLPHAAPLYVARGVLYGEMGRFADGEADFASASRLNPEVTLGAAAQGLSELQENDLPKAEATVRERLRVQPTNAFLCYLLAEILTREGAVPGMPAFAEALGYARTAVQLKPNLNIARDLLSRLYLKDGKVSVAVEQSRAVLRANPHDQTALYHLIVALRKSGDTSEVPKLLKQLTRIKQLSQ